MTTAVIILAAIGLFVSLFNYARRQSAIDAARAKKFEAERRARESAADDHTAILAGAPPAVQWRSIKDGTPSTQDDVWMWDGERVRIGSYTAHDLDDPEDRIWETSSGEPFSPTHYAEIGDSAIPPLPPASV